MGSATVAEHDAAEYGSFIADDYDTIYGNAFDTQSRGRPAGGARRRQVPCSNSESEPVASRCRSSSVV